MRPVLKEDWHLAAMCTNECGGDKRGLVIVLIRGDEDLDLDNGTDW